MALLSQIPDSVKSGVPSIHEQRNAVMLDNPEKTTRLLTAMKAALPFEVELTSSAIAYLRAQRITDNVKPRGDRLANLIRRR
jgi:hypothetical protein